MSRWISPQGPVSSNVMIVTDIPDKRDEQTGKILSGYQGDLLKRMYQDAGFRLDGVYRTSTILRDVSKQMEPLKTVVQKLKFLRENSRPITEFKQELVAAQPNVIIALGEWPLRFLTGQSGIRKFQGSILHLLPTFDNENAKVVPVQHPREIFKAYEAFYYTPIYLKRAMELRDVFGPFREKIHIEIATGYQTVYNYLKANSNEPFIVADIETYFNMISCIGLSLGDDSAIVIPFLENDISVVELGEICKLLQKAFNHFPYVNQNVEFDHTRLERFGFEIPNVLGDTMLNASLIYPELPKNLGFLNSLYTNIPYFKDEGKSYRPSKQLYLYCGKDCISVRRIFKSQNEELKEMGCLDFARNNVMKYYKQYHKINNIGIQVDGTIRNELREKYDNMRLINNGEIKETLGFNLNPLSPKQCHQLLYDYLGLPKQKKRRAGNTFTETADEKAIENLVLNHVTNASTKALLNKIIQARKIDRILGYIDIPLHAGDIFHTAYNLAGTETGRTSTSKSSDWFYEFDGKKASVKKLGAALQTIPKHGFELPDGTRIGDDIRKMFVPRKGYVFCEGDQSKAEAVIVTVLAKDWDLYEVFYDVNLHKVTAVQVFKLPSVDDVTPDLYNKGKRVRHAANYDMEEKTLAQQALCSVSEAKQMLLEFHKENWKIRGIFHREVMEYVTRNLRLNNPYGRIRHFFTNPANKNARKEWFAHIPQSTVAEKTKIGMVKTAEELDGKLDFHFLGESHDSILAEVREGSEMDYLVTLKKNMEEPIDMRKCCLPRDIDAVIKFECAVGMNWKELKEVSL
jgi:uracil-DNA glycosylase family 4